MTLDANEPTDQRMVSELPSYIRANRVDINANSLLSSSITITRVIAAIGATSLVIPTNLSTLKIEVVLLSGSGLAPITTITGGTEGQIKIFIFQDGNISFTDGPKLPDAGSLYLNQLPALSIFAALQDDVIALANIGGNGAGIEGYWKELWRQISVR